MKFQFESVADKVKVLKEKAKLKQSPEFSRTYIRSSKSHTDRLIEMNFRTILGMIPGGDNMKITANGRLMDKTERDRANEQRRQNQYPGQRPQNGMVQVRERDDHQVRTPPPNGG